VVEHLGVLIDTRQMRVFVTDRKVNRMRKMAQEILLCAQRNRRLVPLGKLRHFCGVAVSLTLALPMARVGKRKFTAPSLGVRLVEPAFRPQIGWL
jgi:hypothetical protein